MPLCHLDPAGQHGILLRLVHSAVVPKAHKRSLDDKAMQLPPYMENLPDAKSSHQSCQLCNCYRRCFKLLTAMDAERAYNFEPCEIWFKS